MRGGRGVAKVKDLDETPLGQESVLDGVAAAQSLSGPCKTTTTLHVSFLSCFFLSFWTLMEFLLRYEATTLSFTICPRLK